MSTKRSVGSLFGHNEKNDVPYTRGKTSKKNAWDGERLVINFNEFICV